MEKYTQSEGKLEVLTGRQANVLNSHFQRTGKYNLDNFTAEERQAFESELSEARQADEAEQKAAAPKKMTPKPTKTEDKSE